MLGGIFVSFSLSPWSYQSNKFTIASLSNASNQIWEERERKTKEILFFHVRENMTGFKINPLEGEKKQQSNFPIETDFLRGEKHQIC